MKHPILWLAAVGVGISLACSGGVSTADLSPCDKHATCTAHELFECLCDADGALHTAETVCSVKFDPPCAAGKVCELGPALEENCMDHDNMGGQGDSGPG